MKVTILPGAATELKDAAAYYQAQQHGLGIRLLETFDTAIHEIVLAPEMYSPLGEGFRKYGLRPFPYAAIYRQDDDDIVIVAVMHQKRRPDYWRGRV